MVTDEEFYRQYLYGYDTGLEALIRKYGDPLTFYINGYLHDVHEAEDLMLEVFSYLFTKRPRIRDGGYYGSKTAYREKRTSKKTTAIPDCCSFRHGGMPCCDCERFSFLARYSQPD
ncbi:MAG: RNA polymerase sigma factor [Clostridium sp.]